MRYKLAVIEVNSENKQHSRYEAFVDYVTYNSALALIRSKKEVK